MSKIYDDFKSPGVYYRGKPFWSWNGKLEKDELLRQVDVLKEMGFGGYFMHSRTGLVTEYLGEEWFELVNAVADKGEKLGLENWLYDEDRWPSGTAGGFVTMNPDYSASYIRCETTDGSEFEFSDGDIIAFSCDMLPDKGEYAFTNDKVITKDTPKEEYADKTVLSFSIEKAAKGSFYNGYTYVDTMNPEAIRRFIDLTHEKYADKCGDRIGSSVCGIFTDEPHRGAVMCGFSTGSSKKPGWVTPFTPKLFEKFTEKYGYDLKNRLPDLFLQRDGEKMSQVKWHYMDLAEDLFLQSFAVQINDWCNDHNMQLTGHVLHEDTFTTQACMIGSIMRFYEHMAVPGVDVLSEGNRGYWIVKQLSSVARQTGKTRMLSELYGCSGWQMDFESHKWTGGWQALFGINLRCHHLSWYSMQGEAKRDYPASILHQSAWYKDYPVVEDFFSRLHVVLGAGKPICDTLVINPVESTFGLIHPDWSIKLGTNDKDVARIEKMYFTQFHWLSGAKLDFDYGDEEMMGRLASVIIEDGTPYIKFGEMKYKSVVVSGMYTMRSTTLNILREFANAGGKVILAGFAPDHIDALKSDAFDKLENIEKIPFDGTALVGALKKASGRTVSVKNAMGDELTDVYAQCRCDGDDTYIVLMNMNKTVSYHNCTVEIDRDGDCEEWFALDGTKALVKSSEDGKITFNTDFYAAGEHVYRVCKKSDLEQIKTLTDVASYPLGEEFDIELSEDNVLVLDIADLEVDGEKLAQDIEVLKADRKVREVYGLAYRGGEMIQPWFLGLQEQKKHGRVALEYSFFAEYIPEKFNFVCETPDLWTVTINGEKLDAPENGRWIDEAFHKFTLDGALLKEGKNTIRLEADFYETLNIEAVYITGDFGVCVHNSDKTVINPVRRVYHGDIAKQGLPFYSGAVTYKADIPYNPGERVIIRLPDFEAAVVKVSANGEKPKAIAWQPYEADITDMLKAGQNTLNIEYVLTRRNTFGPLHSKPARHGAYGPETFLLSGDDWTNDYIFLPAAMTAVPEIIIKI